MEIELWENPDEAESDDASGLDSSDEENDIEILDISGDNGSSIQMDKMKDLAFPSVSECCQVFDWQVSASC